MSALPGGGAIFGCQIKSPGRVFIWEGLCILGDFPFGWFCCFGKHGLFATVITCKRTLWPLFDIILCLTQGGVQFVVVVGGPTGLTLPEEQAVDELGVYAHFFSFKKVHPSK